MSLLAALKNKTIPTATAIPAIRAIRGGKSGAGIAGIAGIAIATETNQKNEDAPPAEKTPGLMATIKRMALFYGYTSDELDYALGDARQHPERWRELIRNDLHSVEFVDTPNHQLEVVAILRADSGLRYAYSTRHVGDEVHLTLAVRDVAVADLTIPADRFDPLAFLKLLHFGGDQ